MVVFVNKNQKLGIQSLRITASIHDNIQAFFHYNTYCITPLTQNLSNLTVGGVWENLSQVKINMCIVVQLGHNLVIYKMSICFLIRLVLEVLLHM